MADIFISYARSTAAQAQQVAEALRALDSWRSTGHWGDFARPVGEDDFECW